MGQKKPETKTQLQARARIMCERDNISQADIGESLGIATRTVANWAERGLPSPLKGPWVKGSLAEKIHQKAEESILEAAKRLGLDSAYFLAKVKNMCEATRPVLVKPSKAEQEKSAEEGDESGGGFVTEMPDYSAIDAGLTHAERIIPGLKAKEQVSIDFPAQMLAFFQGEK